MRTVKLVKVSKGGGPRRWWNGKDVLGAAGGNSKWVWILELVVGGIDQQSRGKFAYSL